MDNDSCNPPHQYMWQHAARHGIPNCEHCGQRLNWSGYASWPNATPPCEVILWHCVTQTCPMLFETVRQELPL